MTNKAWRRGARGSTGLAAVLALLPAAAPAAPDPKRRLTAERALAAHRAATSIGPDPCRRQSNAGDEEVVICGRRESPYALPLYEPPLSADPLPGGREREAIMGTMRDTAAPCHARGEACVRGLPILTSKF